MKFIQFLSIAFLAMAVATSSALAADMGSVATQEFVKKATIGSSFEIASSQLALERSKNDAVKAFAKTMIDDHTAADQTLKSTLTSAGLSRELAPATLDDAHQKMYDDLKAAKEDFNQKYIAAQQKAHAEAVTLFEDYSRNGDNESLKRFATETLPALQQHQRHAKQLKS